MEEEGEARLAAVVFTDVVGFTAAAQHDERRALEALSKYGRLAKTFFEVYRGKFIKALGDGFLAEFASASDAVECAMALQKAVREYGSAGAGDAVTVRVGVHLGDVVHVKGDVLGDAVNIASRIQQAAEPGGVCVSRQVYESVRGKVHFGFRELGKVRLKNVLDPPELFAVTDRESDAQLAPHRSAVDSDDSTEAWGRVKAASFPGLGDEARLAVLPLANLSPDPGDGFFADGLTEELITRLSMVRGLKVIARTSVTRYRATEKRVSEIGKELGVSYVVEGSVRKAGDRIRVTTQLINAATEEHVWASNYDRKLEDVFQIQSEVAEAVADALPANLRLSSEALTNVHAPVPEAYTHYLRAKVFSASTTPNSQREALREFDEALRIDPGLLDAYLGKARALFGLSGAGAIKYDDAREQTRELIARGSQVDPDHFAIHMMRAMLDYSISTPGMGLNHLERALEINPNSAEAAGLMASWLLSNGRRGEALVWARRMYSLDPASESALTGAAVLSMEEGDLEGGLRLVTHFLDFNPGNTRATALVSLYHVYTSSYEKAVELADKVLSKDASDKLALLCKGSALARLGGVDEATKITVELEKEASQGHEELYNYAALIRLFLGDVNGFFEDMLKAARNHLSNSTILGSRLVPEHVKSDPRYEQVKRVERSY